MLHNIEPVDGSFAIRHGDMKLIYAPKHSNSAKHALWYDWDAASNKSTCDDQSLAGFIDVTIEIEHSDVTKVYLFIYGNVYLP